LEGLKEAESLGYKAIFLTVDTVVPGFQEKDINVPFVLEKEEREAERKSAKLRDEKCLCLTHPRRMRMQADWAQPEL
jgi:isopentenyl diphosphate isomerase/L-lactate dehydrogenase-like FMN-dependent dehydrogenase